jgi:hypothetical protein
MGGFRTEVERSGDADEYRSGLKPIIFGARAVAALLKCPALRSSRKAAPPYHSAVSMLHLYINHPGKALKRRGNG